MLGVGDAVVGGKGPDEELRTEQPTLPPMSPEYSRGKPRFHSRYADQTPVFEGQQPPRISGPDPMAKGPHTVLRNDLINKRVYKGREFDVAGNPVRDVDFTNPTYPNGAPRLGHLGPPHQHRYIVNDTAIGPRSGFRRNKPEMLQ
jgi:hypothetical protein